MGVAPPTLWAWVIVVGEALLAGPPDDFHIDEVAQFFAKSMHKPSIDKTRAEVNDVVGAEET